MSFTNAPNLERQMTLLLLSVEAVRDKSNIAFLLTIRLQNWF